MIKATIRGFFYFLHLQKRRMGIFKRFFSKEKLEQGTRANQAIVYRQNWESSRWEKHG